MKDVKPASLLKDRVREVEGNPDFSNKDVAASQTPVVAEVSSGIIPPINHVELQPEINSTSRAMSLPNILNQVGFERALSITMGYILPLLYLEHFFCLQYAAPVRLPPNNMVEDDKIALMMPEQVPSHTLTQVSPSQTPSVSPSPSPFSLSQVCLVVILFF